MIGPDGKVAGVYRKSHIPDGPGYEEKFYFRPGNTGFKVWDGPHRSTLGVGVCWDQWYPETARAMMLMGADILFYPTAIGTEPHDPDLDTSRLWRRAMIGHAVSNVVPVVAANRIGTEQRPALLRPQLHLRRARRHPRRVRRGGDGRAGRDARPRARRRSTAPPSASSATAGPSFTGGSPRTSELQRPLEHALEHRRIEPPGVLVVARAMIARQQDAAVRRLRPPRHGRTSSMPAAGRAPAPPRHARSARARRPRAPSASATRAASK